jgi:hypothetical protein
VEFVKVGDREAETEAEQVEAVAKGKRAVSLAVAVVVVQQGKSGEPWRHQLHQRSWYSMIHSGNTSQHRGCRASWPHRTSAW